MRPVFFALEPGGFVANVPAVHGRLSVHLVLLVAVALLRLASAGDLVILMNGSNLTCTVLRYENNQIICATGGGPTNALPIASIRNIFFDSAAAQPAGAPPPRKVADEVRIVAPTEIDKHQRAHGYLLLMLPVTKYTSLLWVTMEKPAFKEALVGAHKQSGVSWQKIFDCALDRTGQMAFELPPGKYRLNIYAVTSGRHKINAADERPPGRTVRTAEVEITASNVTTYSVKLTPPNDQTPVDGVTP